MEETKIQTLKDMILTSNQLLKCQKCACMRESLIEINENQVIKDDYFNDEFRIIIKDSIANLKNPEYS